ncbi:GNAT family N-acetyltransferase [Rhizobium sp. BK376]|uniref:GNAT family N-acetyltransferase n=1 Tax=Rhizobium sp. BK376 TaxID=2512149 RepID=UPI0010494256|nr:GNAT family N-acetyltransferase [Rhizobium sp. BK376]TCR83546.1 RimJ/RimL family protein N-acetyltransferase [Rhizobium sp. BK376]
MIRIETDRLILRNCEERDRELFFEVNSDPRVLVFHPFQRTRTDADAIFDMLLNMPAKDGLDFLVLEIRETAEPIGFSGLSKPNLAPLLPAEAVEIGWRLSARHWGHGFATEAGTAILAYGFKTLTLDEIISFSVEGNDRSEAVMRRIGMQRDPSGDFDHPDIPDSHPQLRRHILYRLTAKQWRRRQTG